MVRGLDMFRTWFGKFPDQYVLIGGTAASLVMNDAGVDFRQTKDLDVVLHVEALSSEFVATFWEFVRAGGYEVRQAEDTGKPRLFRFLKPAQEDFPYMIELFARARDSIEIAPDSNLTPIPVDDLVSSLSAILLDDEYYDFIFANRRIVDGLPVISEAALIPLKAQAWLNLSAAKETGAVIDSRDIRKHLNDIVALVGLLQPGEAIRTSSKIKEDLQRLIAANQNAVNNKIDLSVALERIQVSYDTR